MSGNANIRPGARLGPYTVGREIGTGATATVYAGTDSAGRPFALKVRRRGQADLDRRFLREFESMRLLRVPGVVPVHGAGIEDAHLWFSMDLVEGLPFHEPVHALTSVEARVRSTIELGRKLCLVLASLHEAGFVHRDIKPTNVLVDARNDVHVLDFGIGRYFTDESTLSATGEVLGTVPYMAPEQLGGLPSDQGVDLFAAGLLLHEAIAGARPRPLTTVGWIPKICLERMPALASLFREVPRGLSHLVDALLSADPADRPPAREAAAELHRITNGLDSTDWPAGPFVDAGRWWAPLESVIGHGRGASVWVLDGATGAGRGRVAEQLHRMALLQGTWTLHLTCRVDRVGGPAVQLLERLCAALDDVSLARIVGDAGVTLRRTWPHLPLPMGAEPEPGALAGAVCRVVERASAERAMLLVFHQLEQVDPLTAELIPLLAGLARDNVGMLLLHEGRWATARSRALVATLAEEHGCSVIEAPPLPAEAGERLVQAVCPAACAPALGREPPAVGDGPPLAAVEAGWRALAQWREEAFPAVEPGVWPAAVLGDVAVPLAVFRAAAGEGAEESPWVDYDERGVVLSGRTAALLLRSRLVSLERSAAALARVWERAAPEDERAGDLARLWLLASEPERAVLPATRAAVHAEHFELYPEARRWLLLLDSLPRGAADPDAAFELAVVRARVALHTDAQAVDAGLFDAADALVRTTSQDHRARLLRAELGLREGEPRAALVIALRVGSTSAGASGPLQVQALLLAVRCRMLLGQPEEAARDLDRAEALLEAHPDPMSAVRATNARAELARAQQDLLWCRALCQQNIRTASQHRYQRGVGESMHRLGQVLRMLGRRREAEQQMRAAREVVAQTGDAELDAETGLALGTLLVERGEQLPARLLLDATLRRIRGLSLDHLLPSGMRLALQIAVLSGELADATSAIAGIHEVRGMDPEAPAALVQWFRARGDMEAALDVIGPDDLGYGRVLWRIERARAAMMVGQATLAREELERALERAALHGFAELQVYAGLVSGAFQPVDDEAWAELQQKAAGSMFTEVFLGAVEMDARRLARSDPAAARTRWRALHARARELGYRPGVQEAEGWLGEAAP